MRSFYLDNRLVNKFSAQKGVINPLVIGGVVVIGIIVFLIASGTFKFSGSIDKPASQDSQVATQPTEKPRPKDDQPLAEKPEVKMNAEPFTDSKLGFSISYPEGWKVKSATTNATVYKPSDTKGSDKADALVSIVVGDLGELKDTKLSSIADLHKVYIKKQFSNVEFTGEKEVKVNNQDGYELDFTGSINSENMQAKYIVLKGEKNLYAVIEMANIGIWKDTEKELDASVQSFKMQ